MQHSIPTLRRICNIALLSLLLHGVLTACSSIDRITVDEHQLGISNIVVDAYGKPRDEKPDLVTVCKGFILGEQQVRDFFQYAYSNKEDTPSPYYEKLPCYSSGTALINGKPYQWVIHAGGIGEFFNDKERFIKVCGKNCCDKVPHIC